MISSPLPAFAKLGPKLERIEQELAHLSAFLARYDALAAEFRDSWGRTTVIAAAVHNAYNGVEDVLLSLASDVDAFVPQGASSHQDILDQMRAGVGGVRPPLLDDGLYRSMMELKAFRHVVRHRYGMDLDAARADENLARLRDVLPRFVEAVQTLERYLRAPPGEEGTVS